jgi:hypothetical protein
METGLCLCPQVKSLLSWAQSIELVHCPDAANSSIIWAQLSRFLYLRTEAESSLHNVVLNKKHDG